MAPASLLVAGCLLGVTAMLLGPLPSALARAPWAERSPGAGLALWLAITCTAGLSVVGALLTLAVAPLASTLRHSMHVFAVQVLAGNPLRGLGPTQILVLGWAVLVLTWLILLLVQTFARQARHHHRHRQRIDLVATRTGHGVQVVDYATPAAYCLPGLRPRVVITSGLVGLLTEPELAAVLDHERAHARGRHHLIVLPFSALAAALPRLPAFRLAHDSASRLVEMLADDYARRRHGGTVVATALVRLAASRADAAPPPAQALGAVERSVVARVRRLTEPMVPIPLWQRVLVYAASFGLIAGPAVLLLPCVI